MIVKELDPFQSEDKLAKSGRAAEEQMAFYLKRFFATDSDVLVLNGVRRKKMVMQRRSIIYSSTLTG